MVSGWAPRASKAAVLVPASVLNDAPLVVVEMSMPPLFVTCLEEAMLTGTGSIASSRQVTNNGGIDISTTTSGASFKTLAGTNTAALLALGAQPLTITAGNSTNYA